MGFIPCLKAVITSLTLLPHFPLPSQKSIDVVEQLGNDIVSTGIDLLLQVVNLCVFVFLALGMPVGICYSPEKVSDIYII